MAKTIDQYFDDLRETRVWRSIFRSGTGSSTLKRALAIQQNVFLHLFSTKVRTRMLRRGVLDPSKREAFLKAAETFPKGTKAMALR